MHDSDQQSVLPLELTRVHRALDCVEAVLSLEQQRLQLLIERRQVAKSARKHLPGSACGADAVIRIRRAA